MSLQGFLSNLRYIIFTIFKDFLSKAGEKIFIPYQYPST